jgi:hypothetical protein
MNNPPLTSTTQQPPVIVDVGRQSRKRIKRLRDGRGKLMRDINEVLGRLRLDGTVKDGAQVVVVVVTERPGDDAYEWWRGCAGPR